MGVKVLERNGLSEVAVCFSAWPGGFPKLLRCWRRFQELATAPGFSGAESDAEKEYYKLFQLTGSNPPRIYFGNEFCEHRIPASDELENACTAAAEAGFPITILTPPCGEGALQQIESLLGLVETCSPGSEIVANDWGVLRLLRTRHPSLVPVLGRLMTRVLRDPRITPLYVRPDAPADALAALQGCSVSVPAFRKILSDHRVERVELDYLFQGIGTDFRTLGLRPSVYVPFGYVSTGRICLFANFDRADHAKFELREACGAACRAVEAEVLDRQPRGDGGVHTYIHRGNTFFYRQDASMVSEALAWTIQQEGRLVFQPGLPF